MRLAVAVAALAVAASGTARAATLPANRCVALRGEVFFVKPTGLGTAMFSDRDGRLLTPGGRTDAPGPEAEWALRPRGGHRYELRSTQSGRVVRATLTPVRACRPYPEADLGADGRAFRSASLGFADPHVHVVADLRAGGGVISGESFDRFGITEALGHDEDVHGPMGSLDVTGNLLRSGSPAGTHDTAGWPSFTGWPTNDTNTHQQVYWRWLQRAWMAGMRLMVAQTVEDEPLCRIEPRRTNDCDETATIELQVQRLRALQDYVDAQYGGRGRGWFRLVFTPRQARAAMARGQLAVVIGAESSDPFGCSQFEGEPHCDRAAIDRGIARLHRAGVRSLFLAHWVDNALAGAALEGGDKGVFIGAMQLTYTGRPFATGPCPAPEQGEAGPLGGARQCNPAGLTDLGAYAVRRLMDRHMLIEADHLGEWAREKVLDLAGARGYPLVSSHTGTGGAWSADELRRLFASGGFASATVDDAGRLPAKVLAFGRAVGLSTDTGGFATLPGPTDAPLAYPFRSYDGRVRFARQRTGTRTFDLNADGVAHYGLLADLLADVQRRPGGPRALQALFGSAAAYVRTWQRATSR